MAAVPELTFDATHGVLEAQICNRALVRIGVDTILDTEETTIQAQVCRSVYAACRDELLRYVAPVFATKTALAPLDDSYAEPMNGFSYAYALDDFDVVRLLRVAAKDDAVYETVDNGFNRRLFTDEAYTLDGTDAAMEIKYIDRVIDMSKADELFIEALVLAIAYKAAMRLATRPDVMQVLRGEAEFASRRAMMASLAESQHDPYDTKWTDRGVL